MLDYYFNKVIFRTITPLHVGCGQDVGLVDNPIIREKTTQFPFIPGSGIRGVLRDRLEKSETQKSKDQDKNGKQDKTSLKNILFGPEPKPGENVEHAGCISVHDAKILLFPVRTNKDLFHWITCPYVIDRFNRDAEFFRCGTAFNETERLQIEETKFLAPNGFEYSQIAIEEFPFQRENEESLNSISTNLINWLEANGLQKTKAKTLMLSNQAFDYFVRNATIIMQHNQLTSAKTVKEGALFSVEAVPPETYFYGIIGGTTPRKEEKNINITNGQEAVEQLFKKIKENDRPDTVLALGGDESTGLGVTQMYWKN